MNNKILWSVLVVIIVVLVGAYFFNKNKSEIVVDNRDQVKQEVEQRPEVTLNAKHQFKDGEHTFVGVVELPTPCHTITTNVVKESNQTIVEITTAAPSEFCAQVITQKEFTVTFEGTEDENIIARLNGELVNLNLFEVPADQDIDDIDISIKG